MRGIWRTLSRRISKQELVGKDPAGNEYLRQLVVDPDGVAKERRWVEFPSEFGGNYYDASKIPAMWHQWLNNRRKEPPSEEAVLQAEAAREAIRQKAAAIEGLEMGRKLRAHAYGIQEQTSQHPPEPKALPDSHAAQAQAPQQEVGVGEQPFDQHSADGPEHISSWEPPKPR